MMSMVPAEVTHAIREVRPIEDSQLEALREFAHVMTESRGNRTLAETQGFLDAGYTEDPIFHTELDPAFSSRAWEAAV